MKPEYIITTQLTEDYYKKSQPLFKSIAKYWPHRFVAGFIDFVPKDYKGEYYVMHKSKIATYSPDYPKNRKGFVCPQGGEFIDYLDCASYDIIIEIDADTVMQRAITEQELECLIPDYNQIIAVNGANPPVTLAEVAKNLKFKDTPTLHDGDCEFAASFLVARAATFAELKDCVTLYWPMMLKICEHHAGIQWIISYLAHKFFDVKIIDSIYQCADWYIKFDTTKKDKKLYYKDKLVIFNHTKFNI